MRLGRPPCVTLPHRTTRLIVHRRSYSLALAHNQVSIGRARAAGPGVGRLWLPLSFDRGSLACAQSLASTREQALHRLWCSTHDLAYLED